MRQSRPRSPARRVGCALVIDLRLLRDDPDLFRASQTARGRGPGAGRRAARRRRGPAHRRHPLRRAAQRAEGPGQGGRQGLRPRTSPRCWPAPRTSPTQVKAADAQRAEATARADELVLAISNLVHPDSPRGGEEDFTVLEQRGTIRDFAAEGITVRDHLEIGEALRRDRRRARREGVGLALLLPDRRRRPARARPGQPRDGPGDRQRAHADHPAGAGEARGDGGHRLPRPGRRERLPARGRRHVPRRHRRGPAGGLPLRRDPARPTRCRAATPATPRASGARPARTARTPAASSACTGSTRWRCSPSPPPRTPRPSTRGCWGSRSSSSTASSSPTA